MSNKNWMVNSSHFVLKSRWLNVRADACITPSGVSISPYYIIETPDFAHVLASDEAGQIVLVRQYRHGFGNLSLELPGGMVDANEDDTIAVAARELREETGYWGKDFVRLMTFSPDPARYSNRIHFIRAYNVIAGHPNPEATEDIETVLVSPEEAIRLARTGAIQYTPHACAILISLAS